MRKVKSLLNKMSSPMRPPAGLGDLRLTKSFVSKVFSFFITTQSAEDSRQRRSGMTALFDVKAFTLVELLVVVLIIGILSAIAIPMYQGAVDKSHWSTMLPASKAIKDAEEAFKMTNGEYSDTMEHLDVQINNDDLTFTLSTPNNLADPNVIRVTNSKLDNVRLASYLDDSPMFAGQLHCEVLKTDERAKRLCGKLLNGEELPEANGYNRYLLDQSVTQAICKDAQGSWSSSKTTCYQNTASRCSDLDMDVVSTTNDQCGYIDNSGTGDFHGQTIAQEAVCYGSFYSGCAGAIVEAGGTCLASGRGGSCGGVVLNGGTCTSPSHSCNNVTINEGGVCEANGYNSCSGEYGGHTVVNQGGVCKVSEDYTGGGSCYNIIVNDGGRCIAPYKVTSGSSNCTGTYNGTGCCEGAGCPASAPKCQD